MKKHLFLISILLTVLLSGCSKTDLELPENTPQVPTDTPTTDTVKPDQEEKPAEKDDTDTTVPIVTLSKIEIASRPTKRAYNIYDTLNTEGLTLWATYSDGTVRNIASDFACSPSILDQAGDQIITVTYREKTTTFTVSVAPDPVSRIEIVTPAQKTTYYEGELPDTTGLELSVTHNSGRVKTINEGFICLPNAPLVPGAQAITISYGGLEVSYTVNVIAEEVTVVEISTFPDDMTYYAGETLNTKGIQLKVTYNSGRVTTVSDGFTYTPTAPFAKGKQTVTVIYSGKSATFTVNVAELLVNEISIKSYPNLVAYYSGETLKTDGLVLNVVYNSGKTETKTSGFTCSEHVLITDKPLESRSVTVHYGDKTTAFTVDIKYASPGLSFALSSDRTYYTLVGVGSCTHTDILIPPTHYGIPVTHIGNNAFEGCLNVRSIVIPDGVGSIGNYAFSDCESLVSIVIPDGVSSIGHDAFANCFSLASITLPEGIKTIDSYTFYNCTSLAAIAIPDSVTKIGAHTFDGCSRLKTVVIPDSVTIIQSQAFAYCHNLTVIYCEATDLPAQWNSKWIGDYCSATVHWGYKEN